MKKIALATFAFCALSLGAKAQRSKGKIPQKQASSVATPTVVTEKFSADYAEAKPSWSKTHRGNFRANFINADGFKEMVEFNSKGEKVVSKVMMRTDALPEIITTALAKDYADYSVAEATKNTRPEIAPYYFLIVKNNQGTEKRLLMSEEGSISE